MEELTLWPALISDMLIVSYFSSCPLAFLLCPSLINGSYLSSFLFPLDASLEFG